MNARFVRPAVLAIVAAVLSPVQPPAAHAVTQPDTLLIANQWKTGCDAWSEKVLTFNTATNTLVNLGAPTVSGVTLHELVDAKPIDLNNRVLALWGGSASGPPVIGIYDRTATPVPRWTKAFRLWGFEVGGGQMPHAIEALPRNEGDPNEYFAIATVGDVGGTGSDGWVAVVKDDGTVVDKERLVSAHGVHWDQQRDNNAGALWANGWDKVVKYSYSRSTHLLSAPVPYDLPKDPPTVSRPDGAPGGHDIRRRRQDTKFYVTADTHMWVFDPDATVKFSEIRVNNAPVTGIKGIDQRYGDFKVEYNYHGGPATYLPNGATQSFGNSCVRAYRGGRWLNAPGQKVYDEDQGGGGGSGMTWSPTFRIGDGANAWWIEVYTDADVTGMEANIRDGERYVTLTKQAWGAWAVSPPVPIATGDNMKLIARRSSDGATAATVTFDWKMNANPATEPGWVCRITPASGSSTGRVEVSLDAPVGTGGYVETRVGTSLWTRMDLQPGGTYAKDINTTGKPVVVRAVRGSDGAKAYSLIYQSWPPA